MKLTNSILYLLDLMDLENFSNMQLNLNNKLLNTCTYTIKDTN